MPTIRLRRFDILLLTWCTLTAVNLFKAFHMDDTFHLEAAEHILSDPARPMSGQINWEDDPTLIYTHNQPPLFFYLIAAVIKVFGPNEFALHLLLSVFTFLALYFFQELTRLLAVRHDGALLLLFAFSPATVVNQNVMTDMPLLAFVLGSVYYLIRASQSGKWRHYVFAALLLGLGLLVKYAIIPLLLVFPIVMLANKHRKHLLALAIPVGMLLLWSLWNYWEFGAVHLANRTVKIIHIEKLWSFIACLGAVSVFAPAFIYGIVYKQFVKAGIYASLSLLLISFFVFYFCDIREEKFSMFLAGLFLLSGFMVVVSLGVVLVKETRKGLWAFLRSPQFVLFLCLSSLSLFIVLFAPFNATRHVLLALPFVLLLGHELIGRVSRDILCTTVAMSIVTGLLLGISDWKFADYYRKMAAMELPNRINTWTVGHWGWQWYARKNGMKAYATSQSVVREGDYFVYPADISKQKISPEIELVVVDKIWREADFFTFFSGKNSASLYSSTLIYPPWNLSKKPVDTIYVCRVTR